MNDRQKDAALQLNILLERQPGLLSAVVPSETSGAAVADFCLSFIRKYSDGLKQMESQSQR